MQTRRASKLEVDDRFCFELTSLVLALSGTPAGLKHLASLPGTLATVVSLLQIGTGRLQRTAIVIVRRSILQSMAPDACDRMLRPRIQLIRANGFAGLSLALIASSFSVTLRIKAVSEFIVFGVLLVCTVQQTDAITSLSAEPHTIDHYEMVQTGLCLMYAPVIFVYFEWHARARTLLLMIALLQSLPLESTAHDCVVSQWG